MKAIEDLKTEHRAIERMLDVLGAAATKLDAGERVRPDLFREAADFVRNFADRCHHGKEEENLFPRMESAGVPRAGGPLGVMLHEHEEGREYIAGIEGALGAYEDGDDEARRTVTTNVRGYIALLREHILKEEEVLFPMAESVLAEDDLRQLAESFERVETEVMGPGVHERYHQLLDDLEREMGLAVG